MSSQRYISDTLKQKKKTVRKVKTYLILLACILVLVGIVFLMRMSNIQISEVKITGNSFVPTEEIEKKANAVLDSYYLFVIPKRNIFLFPKRELVSKIKENPAVISVDVNKNLFKEIEIAITEQEKEAIYCSSFERSECFYINKDGYLYSRTPADMSLDQEIIIYLESERKEIKEYVLDSTLYTNVVSFIKASSRYGVPIANVYIKSDGIIEFNTQASARLITSRYDDMEKDFANFIALFDQKVLTKEQLGGIDYIDLRFGNKVFYKNR